MSFLLSALGASCASTTDNPLVHTLKLQWIIDPQQLQSSSLALEKYMCTACQSGVTMVQVRMPQAHKKLYARAAKQVAHWCARFGVPVIINDAVSIATLPEIQGIHIGQQDDDPAWVRQHIGQGKSIGLTVHNQQQINSAMGFIAGGAVDYLSVGAIFASNTKTHQHPPQGVQGLKHCIDAALAAATVLKRQPPLMIAVSGIDQDNVASVMACGVHGVAISSAITRSQSAKNSDGFDITNNNTDDVNEYALSERVRQLRLAIDNAYCAY